MNSLERSLVEKAGYDNGWERSSSSSDENVLLSSTRHGFSVSVRKGSHDDEWATGRSAPPIQNGSTSTMDSCLRRTWTPYSTRASSASPIKDLSFFHPKLVMTNTP